MKKSHQHIFQLLPTLTSWENVEQYHNYHAGTDAGTRGISINTTILLTTSEQSQLLAFPSHPSQYLI